MQLLVTSWPRANIDFPKDAVMRRAPVLKSILRRTQRREQLGRIRGRNAHAFAKCGAMHILERHQERIGVELSSQHIWDRAPRFSAFVRQLAHTGGNRIRVRQNRLRKA